jgi:hypothetical protein
MGAAEPAWFRKLSEPARRRAREWLRTDPAAFAEISAADKRGRPKTPTAPNEVLASMAALILDNPGMRPFTAARLSLHLAPDWNHAPHKKQHSICVAIVRAWQEVGQRRLAAEQRRRRQQDTTQFASYGIAGLARLTAADPEMAAVLREVETQAARMEQIERAYGPVLEAEARRTAELLRGAQSLSAHLPPSLPDD